MKKSKVNGLTKHSSLQVTTTSLTAMGLTCHITRPDSVTCHPAEVTFPPLSQHSLLKGDMHSPQPKTCTDDVAHPQAFDLDELYQTTLC